MKERAGLRWTGLVVAGAVLAWLLHAVGVPGAVITSRGHSSPRGPGLCMSQSMEGGPVRTGLSPGHDVGRGRAGRRP